MNFIFPNLPKLSLWDLACCLTNQNAGDNTPTNSTRHKLAELVKAIFAGILWVEWEPGIDVDFIQGFLPNAAKAKVQNDWKSLDAVTIRREDWEAFTASIPVSLPGQPVSPEYTAAWFDSDASMSASYWWVQPSITAQQAASLLCGFNPNSQTEIDFKNDYSGNTRPADYKKALNAFEALERATPKNRMLKDWLEYAPVHNLTIHSWLGVWIEASGVMRAPLAVSTPQPAPAIELVTSTAKVPKLRQQEIEIMGWLKENGHDAQNQPQVKNGTSTMKAAAREALDGRGLFGGATTFSKAWDRLREHGAIKASK